MRSVRDVTNFFILGISEIRWTYSGRITTRTEETTLYSGIVDGHHHEKVAIILKIGMAKYLME